MPEYLKVITKHLNEELGENRVHAKSQKNHIVHVFYVKSKTN